MTRRLKGSSILLVVCLAVVAIFFFNANQTQAIEPEVKVVNKLVRDYFHAIQEGDIPAIMKMVTDTRWEDEASQRAGYEAILKEDMIYQTEVLSIEPATNQHYGTIYNANMKVWNQTNGQFEITLPVVKDNGSWKLLIVPQDVPPAEAD